MLASPLFSLTAAGSAILFLGLGYASGAQTILLLALLAMGAQGSAILHDVLANPHTRWSISRLHAGALLFWYGLGSAFGLAAGDGFLLQVGGSVSVENMSLAGLLILATVFGMLLFSRAEHHFWKPVLQNLRVNTQQNTPFMTLFILGLTLAMYYFLANDMLALRDVVQGAGKNFVLLIKAMFLASLAGLAWMLGEPGALYRASNLILLVLVLPIAAIILISLGRLPLALYVGSILLFFGWRRGWRFSPSQILMCLLIASPLIFVGSQVFHGMRIESRAAGYLGKDNAPLLQALEAVGREDRATWGRVLSDQLDHLPHRTFFLHYPAALIDVPWTPNYGLGDHQAAQVVIAIPNAFLPNKHDIIEELGGIGEDRLPAFGLPNMSDFPNTLFTTVFLDFGFATPFIVMVMVPLIGASFALLIRFLHDPMFQIMGIGICLVTFFTIEGFFVSASLVAMREIAFLLPFAFLAVASAFLLRPARIQMDFPGGPEATPPNPPSQPARPAQGGQTTGGPTPNPQPY
ncbi:MAG: hypothetical protein ACPGOY_02590 [Rhodospirillaceae bacterium]